LAKALGGTSFGLGLSELAAPAMVAARQGTISAAVHSGIAGLGLYAAWRTL
jgi:hypothetical protein